MIIVSIPALEFWILSFFQHVLLSLEIGMVETHPSPALHADGVHPVHETKVLEVITVSKHIQPPASEALPLVEHYLREEGGLSGALGTITEGFLSIAITGVVTDSVKLKLQLSITLSIF